jgi:SAM-dependent methyltransferase
MAYNPHFYTLRKRWARDEDFVRTATYIRERGYPTMFEGRPYTQLDVNEHFYWTMPGPMRGCVLINRKVRQEPAAYDVLAPRYDVLFSDSASAEKNATVGEWLGDLTDKSVLDVGCGTGLLLDVVHGAPTDYTGIDPSRTMLDELVRKHPERQDQVICTPLRSFVGKRYDLVAALFGTASYLSDEDLERVGQLLNPGGRMLLMFYAPDYNPVTHRNGVELPIRLGGGRSWHQYVVADNHQP